MPCRPITPSRRRQLARLQHAGWVDAHRYDIRYPLPLQLYKHLRRINLPRQVRSTD